jgi:hypothetical protein
MSSFTCIQCPMFTSLGLDLKSCDVRDGFTPTKMLQPRLTRDIYDVTTASQPLSHHSRTLCRTTTHHFIACHRMDKILKLTAGDEGMSRWTL